METKRVRAVVRLDIDGPALMLMIGRPDRCRPSWAICSRTEQAVRRNTIGWMKTAPGLQVAFVLDFRHRRPACVVWRPG